MLRRLFLSGFASVLCFSAVFLRVSAAPAEQLTPAQIAAKNVAARGGLTMWRSVQTMSMNGKMDAGKKVQLPFVMELKRPRKTRLELEFNGQTAIQVYDGTNGWKLRPFLGRHEVEPYTAEEMKSAAAQADLDGPLVDYVTKGSKLELEGMDDVEGRNTYRLKITMKNGQVRRIWIDANTFLEARIDGSRTLDGKPHKVFTYFRDYKTVNGLMIPYLFETAVEGVKETEKLQIEKVIVNPALEDSHFTKPE